MGKQPFADVLQNFVFKNFAKFAGKNLLWSLFSTKFLETRFLQNTSGEYLCQWYEDIQS